jgi:hypothetical protein
MPSTWRLVNLHQTKSMSSIYNSPMNGSKRACCKTVGVSMQTYTCTLHINVCGFERQCKPKIFETFKLHFASKHLNLNFLQRNNMKEAFHYTFFHILRMVYIFTVGNVVFVVIVVMHSVRTNYSLCNEVFLCKNIFSVLNNEYVQCIGE